MDAWEACKDADVLLESPSAMAGVHIAEALGKPSQRVVFRNVQLISFLGRHSVFPNLHYALDKVRDTILLLKGYH